MSHPNGPEQFWAKVDKGPDCWIFHGASTAPGWHGVISMRGHRIVAHRVAWELTYGPIPAGLRVLHRCDNPPCVRPDHLWLGTQRDNMRDAASKGRMGPQIRDFTHCKHGHLLAGDNVYIHPGHGRRTCRECIKRRGAEYRARRRGAAA